MKFQCDICGKFISFTDLESGEASRKLAMTLNESYETFCKKHLKEKIRETYKIANDVKIKICTKQKPMKLDGYTTNKFWYHTSSEDITDDSVDSSYLHFKCGNCNFRWSVYAD